MKPEEKAVQAACTEEVKVPVLRKDWRLYVGVSALLLSIVLPFLAVVVPYLGLPLGWKAVIAGSMVVGGPEVLTLVAVALLGKETLHYFIYRGKKMVVEFATLKPVSRGRYYTGLVLSLMSVLPLYAYGYVPHLLPSGSSRITTLAIADLVFVASVFIMGEEFWDKLRRIFTWEGKG